MMGVTDLQKACMWRPQIRLSGKSGGDGPATTFSGCKESSPGAYFDIDEIERGMVTLVDIYLATGSMYLKWLRSVKIR